MTAGPRPAFFDKYPLEAYNEQVELGNITENDVDLLNKLNSRADATRRLGLIGGAALGTVYARYIRKPQWGIGKTFVLSTCTAVAGAGASTFFIMRDLFRTMNSFEDKERFNKAAKAIREYGQTHPIGGTGGWKNRTAPRPKGNEIPANGATRGDDADGTAEGSFSWPGGTSESLPGTSNSSSTVFPESTNPFPTDTSPTSGPDGNDSRWAAIRSEHGQQKTTSWDRLRQQKPATPPSPSSSSSPSVQRFPDRDSVPVAPEELKDQEKFDALLEAERNYGVEKNKKTDNADWRWS